MRIDEPPVVRPTRRALAALVALLGATTVAIPAAGSAQDCDGHEEQAMALTREARASFQEARYERSRDLLERAMELCPQPIIVFNLARVSIETGDPTGARAHYARYLELRPDAPDREEVERRIASLEDDIAEREQLERDAREARDRAAIARRDADRARARARQLADDGADSTGPWAVGVAGLTVFGAGVGFAVAAQVESDVGPDVDHRAASAVRETARTYALVANIGLAVGGAALLAASVWGIVLASSSGRSEAEARLRLGLGQLSLEGAF